MQQNNGKGMSIAALVLGIVAVVLAWFYMVNIVAIILGVVGIVLAILGSKKSKAAGLPTGLATAGLVLSIIGTALAVIGFLSCTVCVCIAAETSGYNDLVDAIESLQ